ncbi:anti-sigma factor RsiW [Granulicella aggregans]|uniref:Anti-sigma factor RsiW n=1 Tax=Granulicella aggregans TaxID=474949 RepID=A0A7W7ZI99_9BACT|nr:anti-sigma factor RsiW [Granulicella aggregans]
MNHCDEIRPKLQLLVDGELVADDQEEVLSHLHSCQGCQREVEELEAFSRQVRAARPQIQASASLRQNIENIFAQDQSTPISPSAATRMKIVPSRAKNVWQGATAAAICFAILTPVLLVVGQRRHNANMIRIGATRAQQDLESQKLPLDITTDSSKEVSDWFKSHLSFPFHMADAGIATEDRAKYKLAGGRLMTVNGERAALLSFKLPDEQISMIVLPGSAPMDTSGTTVHSDGVTLHAREQDGMHIVSWENRGQKYILVSHTTMSAAGSCTRCHAEGHSDNHGNQQSAKSISSSTRPSRELLASTTDLNGIFPTVKVGSLRLTSVRY